VCCETTLMKWCPRCKNTLPPESFAWSKSRKNGGSYCRNCQSEYCKAHYREHVKLHNQRRHLNQKRYRKRDNQRLREYLSQRSCIDCGEPDIRVLEFDHVRGVKAYSISEMCGTGFSWRRIEAEIAKCEIRCANCHRRRTVEQFGWWRGIGA
jgi:hypothetical protein